MRIVPQLWPLLLILVAVVIGVLPWDESPTFAMVPPLLIYAVVHRCVERWGDGTPDWLVFAAGLATDVVGQGPLGYWALIYLAGYTMIRSNSVDRTHGIGPSVLLFAVTIVTLSLMQWSLTSIYTLRSAEIMPIVVAAAAALCAYLLLCRLLPARAFDYPRVNSRLERGL